MRPGGTSDGGSTMRAIRIAGLAAALCALMGTASAATLDSVSGQVWVDKGRGPQLVRGSVQVNPGDVVTVGAGGSARIVYANGCTAPAAGGMAMTVTMDSQCIVNTVENTAFLGVAAAVGLGATIAIVASKDRGASP